MVEVNGLRVQLRRTAVDIVDEIGFTIAPGHVLGLVGESGSGKTTVGMALLGHASRGAVISGGEVTIQDTPLTFGNERELRALRGAKVAYIPQDPGTALNPALRIGTQLREVLDAHDRDGKLDHEARVREVLAEVAMPSDDGFLRRYPHQLSGGQQQRVAIAMAFALRPAVIVCDEPTTGLDVTTQARVLETIRDLCRSHQVAALYVSHDLAVVSALADRVAVMYAGRIVELGPRDQIFGAARHPYTRRLLRAIPDMSGARKLTGIAGHAPLPGQRPGGCAFHPRCALATARCRDEAPVEQAFGESSLVRCHHALEPDALPLERSDARRAPTAVEDALLRIDDLAAAYGSAQVVRDINLAVEENECLAIVGESGSGKTTLARCIGGLHRHWVGQMSWNGQPLAAGARARTLETRRQIQYVFQNPYSSLNPRRTVGQTLARQLELFEKTSKRDTSARVGEVLERVSLSRHAASLFPDQLSGGERQRVAIARAIVVRPRLLLCDEVTSALDVSVQAAVVALLAELREQMGLTMVFITHNLALIRSVADRVVVMTGGEIVEQGRSEEVFSSPESSYTRDLLAASPVVEVIQ